MQIAGVVCAACKSTVLFDDEGTWCVECERVFHKECLVGREPICPSCRKPVGSQQERVLYSHYCANCMTVNDPVAKQCTICGCRTSWDTQDEYDQYKRTIMHHARWTFLAGIAGMALGVGGLLWCALVVWTASVRGKGVKYVAIFSVGAIAAGGVKIRDAVRRRSFR